MSPRRPAAADGEERLVVTQVRSSIGVKPKHRATLRALGLRRLGAANELPDRPEIRGMLAKVTHLVAVAPAETAAATRSGTTRSRERS